MNWRCLFGRHRAALTGWHWIGAGAIRGSETRCKRCGDRIFVDHESGRTEKWNASHEVGKLSRNWRYIKRASAPQEEQR